MEAGGKRGEDYELELFLFYFLRRLGELGLLAVGLREFRSRVVEESLLLCLMCRKEDDFLTGMLAAEACIFF